MDQNNQQPANSMQQQVAQKPQGPVAPPVSPQKEVEPVVQGAVGEYVAASETEPRLDSKVREAGVEKVSELPNLTLEDQRAGIEYAGEITPVATQPVSAISLPMTEEEVQQAKKTHRNPLDAFVWKINLIWKALKKASLTPKK